MTSLNDMPADIVEAASSIVTDVCVKRGQMIGFREMENEYLEQAIARAILAEREKCAVLAETVSLPKTYSTGHMKLACKVAARAIRRGRHLTSEEKAANVQRWLDSVEVDA